MLHIAALAAGLIGVWGLLAPSLDLLGVGVLAALLAALFAARLAAADREGAALLSAIRVLTSAPGARWKGAAHVARAALFGPARLRPALARFRTRDANDIGRAGFVGAVSSIPGIVAVETSAESELLHTTDEETLDARALSALEGRIVGVRA